MAARRGAGSDPEGLGCYPAAFGCAAASVAFTVAALLDTDYGEQILSRRNLGLAEVGLLLAVASLGVAVFRPRRNVVALLWTTQAVLGGVAGFGVGEAVVTIRRQPVDEFGGNHVWVEVSVLGVSVSQETGWVKDREGGPYLDSFPKPVQAVWVFGVPTVGGVAGVLAALGVAVLLVRRAG